MVEIELSPQLFSEYSASMLLHEANVICFAPPTITSKISFDVFQIWDFPGQIDFFDSAFDSEQIFSGCGSLVFVIDAQVGMHCLLVV